MDEIRRVHNHKKRELILGHVKKGQYVLDCGCGRGGDLHKWKHAQARVVCIDPDFDSVIEAIRRSKTIGLSKIEFDHGDITTAVTYAPFDVVCYNFSIHYIVEKLEASVQALAQCVKSGGKLIGITPDKDRIRTFVSPDLLGNTVEWVDETHVSVHLIDGPFYSDGARTEPVISRDILEHVLDPWFSLVSWEPMINKRTGFISDIYSTFIFVRK